MQDNPLNQLDILGQSMWVDYIRRDLIASGELRRLIEEDGLRGMTSNPSIFEKAIADYSEAIRRDGKYAKAYCNRGVAYAMQAQLDRALPDLNKALSLNPKYSKALYMRGLVYTQQGLNDKALADFTKALEINAANDKVYYFRGILYYKLGRQDQALADFHQALKINPKYLEA